MRTKQIVGPTIVLSLPLVSLAITNVFPNCLKTFQPTYLKAFVFETAALLAAWAILALPGRGILAGLKALVSRPSARLFLLSFFLLSAVSPCWSRTPSVGVKAAAEMAFCLAWAWVVATYVSQRNGFAAVAWALSAAAVLAAIWGLADFLWPVASDPALLKDEAYRLMRPSGNPNFMAGLLNVGILLAVSQFGRARVGARLASAACLALMGTALFWTRSLAGFVALPFGLAALAFLRGPRWLRVSMLVGAVALCLALLGAVASPKSGVLRRLMGTAMRPESTSHVRPLQWMAAVDMVKERPVLGRGMGGFLTDHPTYRLPAAGLYRWASDKHFAIHPHNEWLQVAVELGIVGLALYLLVLTSAAGDAWRWLQARPQTTEAWAVQAAAAGVVALQVQGMFGVGLRHWDLAPFHWTLVGLLIGTTQACALRREEPVRPLGSWRRWALACVCFALWLAMPVRGYVAQALTLQASRTKDRQAATARYLRAMSFTSHHVGQIRVPFMLANASSRFSDDEGDELAVKLYKEVDSLAPNFARCRLYIGLVYLRQARYVQATKWLTGYLKHNPYSQRARLALARAHEGLGDRAARRRDWPASAAEFRKAFHSNPQSLKAAAALALAEAESGRGREATRWLRWLRRKRVEDASLQQTIQRTRQIVHEP